MSEELEDDWPGKPMRFFGPSGKHPHLEVVDIPVGESCVWCEEEINDTDNGFVLDHIGEEGITDSFYHSECLQRTIFGSVGHIREECSCHGGDFEDPPGMTKREAAQAAVEEYERKHKSD